MAEAGPGPATPTLTGLDPALLMRLPVFAGLGLDQAGVLARQGQRLQFQRGQSIIHPGESGSGLQVMLAGSAQTLRSCGGEREVILAPVGAGDFVGDMSLIDGLPHAASVRCEQRCDVLFIEGTALACCLPLRPILAYALTLRLRQRLHGAHRQIVSLALLDVHDRVMRCLFELAQPSAHGSLQVSQAPARQDMAKTVGASRDMVSRAIRELEANARVTTLPDGTLQPHGHCPE